MAKATQKRTVRLHNAEAFELWLEGLGDEKTSQIVRRRLFRLAGGNLGDCRSLGDGVHELRIDYGKGLRVYFANEGDEIVIILHGGTKKRQQADIDKAKQVWQEIKNEQAN